MVLGARTAAGGRVSTGGGLTPPGWQDRTTPAATPEPSAAYPPAAYPPASYPPASYPSAAYPPGTGHNLPAGMSAHKPGIIALRPLALGDIYDGAVKVIRSNPRATVGLSLIVNLITLLPSAALSIALVRLIGQSSSGGASASVRTLVPLAVPPLFAQLAVVLLSGLLAYVVSEAVLGRKAGLGETWRKVRRRMAPLLAATVLVGLAASVLPVAMIALAALGAARQQVAVVVLAVILAVGLAVLIVVPAGVVTALIAPAIVLERQGPIAGVRRALSLIRGGFWRLLGILLLTGLVTGVASYVLRLPFSILAAVAASILGDRSASESATVAVLSSTLAYLVSGSIVTPFASAVACLLYLDRRIRVEALDVLLIRSVLQDQASGGTPSPVPYRDATPRQAPGLPGLGDPGAWDGWDGSGGRS